MVKKRDAAALTKADLIDGLAGVESRLSAEIGGLDGRIRTLEERVDGNGKDIRRLMLESVETNERVSAIRDDVRRDLRDFRLEFTATLDAFTSKFETIWRESAVYPKLFDEQGATLRGHELRLQALEARRQAP